MKGLTITFIIIGVVVIIAIGIFAFGGTTKDSSSTGSSSLKETSGLSSSSTSEDLPPAENKEPSGITSSQLAEHNKESDCWVAYKGKVYDITNFLPNHKEYQKLLVPLCGESSKFESAFTGKHGVSKVEVLTSQGILKGDFSA